jgi:hypothetical protein
VGVGGAERTDRTTKPATPETGTWASVLNAFAFPFVFLDTTAFVAGVAARFFRHGRFLLLFF